MTNFETDNPLLQFRIWCYDITLQYWYIWLVVLVVAVWLISRHFAKRQREWDEYMTNERKKHEDFKRECNRYNGQIERDRIGLRIATLRKMQGLTQEQLADKAGIQRTHLSRIEAGKYAVALETIQAIAEALGMTVDVVDNRLRDLSPLRVLT